MFNVLYSFQVFLSLVILKDNNREARDGTNMDRDKIEGLYNFMWQHHANSEVFYCYNLDPNGWELALWVDRPLVGKSWPEWTSSHQCTSWPFYSLDGLHFFIRHRMGSSPSISFRCWPLLFLFLVCSLLFFPGLDLIQSYPTHLSTFVNIVPTLVP